MTKKLICIECPNGCVLSVESDGNKIISVEGNNCEKGETYAQSEIENPVRILTSTVLAEGLSLKMIPVRTDGPIPKEKLLEAMKEIRKIKIRKAVHSGDIIVKNLLDLEVNLVSTRSQLST